VVALRDDAEVLQRPRMVERKLAAAIAQALPQVLTHLPRALRIEQHADRQAFARLREQGVGDAIADAAFLP